MGRLRHRGSLVSLALYHLQQVLLNYLYAGHMLQLYNKQGWDFHRDLRTKYGPVSRLQFLFGVSGFPIR